MWLLGALLLRRSRDRRTRRSTAGPELALVLTIALGIVVASGLVNLVEFAASHL